METLLTFINAGIAFAFVAILQTIKKQVNINRSKPVNGNIWIIIVLLGGIPMAVIGIGIEGLQIFKDKNIFETIVLIFYRIFLYSAAASFIYQNYKTVKETVKAKK